MGLREFKGGGKWRKGYLQKGKSKENNIFDYCKKKIPPYEVRFLSPFIYIEVLVLLKKINPPYKVNNYNF